MPELDAQTRPLDRVAQVGATPLSRTMVPNAYGAVWCDAEEGTYTADHDACAILGLPACGAMSEQIIRDILEKIAPALGGTQRYYTFRNHLGHVARARLIPSGGLATVILVDDLNDITNRMFLLKASEREYRELFENAPYGIHRTSLDGKPMQANPALVRLNGYSSEADMMDGMKDVVHQSYVDPDRYRQFRGELERDGKVVDFVSEAYRHGTGERIWISESAWLVRDEAGDPRYMAGTVVEITERMRYLERLRVAAETDALTGLANRAAFYAELHRQVAAAEKCGLTLFLIDCDRFKDVNDVFGHARGDAVLRTCAERLRLVVPPNGMTARLGGDEFAIQVPGLPDDQAVIALASRIMDIFLAPIDVDGARHQLSASVGIASFPNHASSATDLMRNADLALYSVKEDGRGHARLFDAELDRLKQARHCLERDLCGAEARGELELYHQPVVDGLTSKIVGLEALIRWWHPVRCLVTPGDFIPVAEDSGMMLAVGEWAIHEACRHAAALPQHIKVAVNVSALQFRSCGLSKIVAAALAENHLDAARLELEVTESVVLKNESATFQVLEQLRALGVKVALDDFGTGYSTLSYLQRFAFDKVKIDRSFVRSIKTNAVNRAVTRAVLSIGRDLGLDVVAEGIETEAERQTLLSEGCHLMQGFYFGSPVPLAEAAGRIASESLHGLGRATVNSSDSRSAVGF